jgi:alpha-tubulin suppressor-like RCC1 family protein
LNTDGQLGDGTFVSSLTPVPLPAGVLAATTFDSTSLVAGVAHTCALTTAGAAYCWGSNAFGQLGAGAGAGPGARSAAPLPVLGGPFVRLYAGLYHTCGLTAAGAAFCWGRNNSGQLGNGTFGISTTPLAVTGGLTFSNLAMGELHSCGITGPGPGVTGTTGVAGTIYCWGDNEYGQLGLGYFGLNAAPALSPVRVVFQQ